MNSLIACTRTMLSIGNNLDEARKDIQMLLLQSLGNDVKSVKLHS